MLLVYQHVHPDVRIEFVTCPQSIVLLVTMDIGEMTAEIVSFISASVQTKDCNYVEVIHL